MIYGYNSKLSNPGLHTIADFSSGLREELLRARRSDQVALKFTEVLTGLGSDDFQERRRPIIFIAHSFGGIILTNVCPAFDC